MLQLFILHDNEDARNGDYFAASHQNLLAALDRNAVLHKAVVVNTSACSQTADFYTSQFEGNRFIFVGYAHGANDCLLIDNEVYIHAENAYLFNETLFYACGCHAANELGKVLIDFGCKIFLGYTDTITTCDPSLDPFFYHCENAFLKHFMTTNASIESCLKHMYEEYGKQIVHLINEDVFSTSQVLQRNLNRFKILFSDEATDLKLTKSFFCKIEGS
jgi:hypothetical protein